MCKSEHAGGTKDGESLEVMKIVLADLMAGLKRVENQGRVNDAMWF